MNKNKYNISFFGFVLFVLLSTTTSCTKDAATAPKTNNSFSEQFDSIGGLAAKGWLFINNSRRLGSATWQKGIVEENTSFGPVFLFSGYTTSAAGSDYVAISAQCSYPFDVQGVFNPATVISAWMITPALTVKNGDKISFFTRTTDVDPVIPERLEVRMNPTGTGTDVGNDTSSVGQFTKTVLTINPLLVPSGYPNAWARFEYTIANVKAGTKTRFAFRYYKPINTLSYASLYTDLGYIGIDNFLFSSN